MHQKECSFLSDKAETGHGVTEGGKSSWNLKDGQDFDNLKCFPHRDCFDKLLDWKYLPGRKEKKRPRTEKLRYIKETELTISF